MRKEKVLVTGATGFVGIHTILQLLQQGYGVSATLRSIKRKQKVLEILQRAGVEDTDDITFHEADLADDGGWAAAVNGADYVLHIASPFPAQDPVDENDLIIPARDGALRVLKAAKSAGVKRVVLTSSFAAVGYSIDAPGHVYTEADWTDANTQLPPYIKSKTLAEASAWEYVQYEGDGLELVVINPVGIFGPVMGDISSASLDIAIKGILNGTTNHSPDFTMGVVDVRDVANIHIKAMLNPEAAGERFIAAADGVMSFYDVAELIKKERPDHAGDIAVMKPTPAQFYKNMSNKKAKEVLGWNPRSKEAAILASVDSLYDQLSL